jgi:hypothetical protein
LVKFFDLDIAFNFVSGAAYGVNSAYLCLDTGHIFYESGMGDSDELPDDIESDQYVVIPHKKDLGLGTELVIRFVQENLPKKVFLVEKFFQQRGAYSRLKALLEDHELLEKWYKFEEVEAESALRQWCAENGISLDD